MQRLLLIQSAAMLVSVCGCANTEGREILESLRRDGLLAETSNDAAIAPARPGPADRLHLAEGPLTLAVLFDLADRLNPRIAAARAEIGIAGGDAWQSSLYPNPTLDVEAGGFGGREAIAMVGQPIIISDRRDAAVAAGRARMSAERLELESVRRDVQGRIRRAVTEIAYAQRAIELHGELLALSQRTLDIAAARFDARAAPESEAIRARVEVNRLDVAVERLRGELAASGERLDALLGGEHVPVERLSLEPLEQTIGSLLPALEQLKSSVRDGHPAVEAARATVDSAERRVEIERARRIPDITARLGGGYDDEDGDWFLQAGVGIPMPVFDQNQGNVLAARFAAIRARAQADAVASELLGALAEAYRTWESAVARLEIYERKILAEAQRSYEQTLAGYRAGSLAFLDLLDAQRTLTEANVAQVELARSVGLSLADILEILGGHPSNEPFKGDAQ